MLSSKRHSHGHRTFAVVGLGNFGGTVAKELQRFENHVIGIDNDEGRVKNMAETLSQAMIEDARDDVALREAGLSDCDVMWGWSPLGRISRQVFWSPSTSN